MQGDPTTVGGGVFNALDTIFELMFRWMPATLGTFTNTTPYANPNPIQQPITEPVTTTQVVNFLQSASPEGFNQFLEQWALFVAISILFSLLVGIACIYCAIRILQVRHNERARHKAYAHSVATKNVPKTQMRWNHVREQVASSDEKQWRLAILEADIMLSELLDVQGLRGETMADKLKQGNRATFRTIDLAWEAHQMRNRIAHEGTKLHLDERDARRVIGMYEQVFREFKFVE